MRVRLSNMMESGEIPQLLFIGQLKDQKAGPHPIPQFEIHYTKEALPAIVHLIEETGLTALVHPLTDDDLADHTSLAHWIGTPPSLIWLHSIRPEKIRESRVSRNRISRMGVILADLSEPRWARHCRPCHGP